MLIAQWRHLYPLYDDEYIEKAVRNGVLGPSSDPTRIICFSRDGVAVALLSQYFINHGWVPVDELKSAGPVLNEFGEVSP